MPGVSGPDLAADLLRRHPDLKILFISGYTEHPLIGKGEFAGGSLLHKPFTRPQLLSKVHAVLTSGLRTDA
jgi:FixJ family two-component response regulator